MLLRLLLSQSSFWLKLRPKSPPTDDKSTGGYVEGIS